MSDEEQYLHCTEKDRADLQLRIRELEAERDRAAEIAFGIIANAGGGDWTTQTQEWQDAAARWRDEFYGPFCARAAARAKEEQS